MTEEMPLPEPAKAEPAEPAPAVQQPQPAKTEPAKVEPAKPEQSAEKKLKMSQQERERRVAEWKLKKVKETEEFIRGKPIIGIVDIESLPSAQFQEIRKKLRGKADIMITKTMIIRKALDNIGDDGLKKLEGHITGPSGLIVSEENPFSLVKFLKKNRSQAPAKAGMLADTDILVPAGETDLSPGPVLAELKQAGLDVMIERGKIVIRSDSVLVKKGDQVTPEKAAALAKLGITPIKVGLKVNAVYEKGMIYTGDVLDIDEEQFMADLVGAYSSAFNLAVNSGYPTPESIKCMLQKAFTETMNLVYYAKILTAESVEGLLAEGNASASALAALLKEKALPKEKETTNA